MPNKIFICDDEREILKYLDKLLQANGYQVETFSLGTELLLRLESADTTPCNVILQDVRMPDIDGLQMLDQLSKRWPDIPVIIMTAHGTIDDAINAIRQGAYDYITKPFPKEKLLGMLERLIDHRRLARENQELREGMQRGAGSADSIIFRSKIFREVYDLTLQVAESDANILVMGESGTGKELIAAALHRNSPRRDKPFVSLNCAVLSDTLLESQLFGHIRGAFTGAVMNQKGLLEEADGGTLFLDEIGDVSPAVQAKLLRVTQEKDFIILGSTRTRKVDVRFVAATNKDLMTEVIKGRFREDLYYRLNVISINLPPLRERREDIEPLAQHFLKASTRRMKKDVRGIDDEAMQALLQYDWPGNVRELENVMERAVILARSEMITIGLLPLGARREAPISQPGSTQLVALDEVERQHITSILKETGFNKSRAAEILGISRKTLDRKIAEYTLAERQKLRPYLRYSIRLKLTLATLIPLVTAVVLLWIIGASTLYLGMPEQPHSDVRSQIHIIFSAILLFVTLIGISLSTWLGSSLARPIKAVEEGARLLALGEHIPDIVVGGHDEISVMAEEFNIMKHRLIERENEILLLNRTLEEKVAERTTQLDEKNQWLLVAQQELIRAERLVAIGILASGVAHEINNPLAIIRGNAELLEMSPHLDDSDKSEIETVIRQVGRVERIVSNLVAFAGAKNKVIRSFNIEILLNDILDQIGHQILLDGYSIERRYVTGGETIEGDEDQLRQVFTNLIVNGLQAMETGGALTVSTSVEREAGSCSVTIHDCGSGITADAQNKLFTPFFTTKPHGTGLGLAVSYGIVKDHCGDIRVESKPEQGATFIVTLPLRQTLGTNSV